MLEALLGEFLGTLVLIVFGSGVVANVTLKKTFGNNSGWMVITTGWALGVTMGVFVAQAVGSAQADINPAVTFAKVFMGVYSIPQALLTMFAQLAGAFYGAWLIFWFYRPHFAITECNQTKMGIFCTAPAIRSYGNAFFCETFAAVILITVIFAIFAKLDAKVALQFGPYLVGMLVWAIGLSLGGATGYAINPARDLGPRLAHRLMPIPNKCPPDWKYAAIPVVAPLLGGFLAFGIATLFGIIK